MGKGSEMRRHPRSVSGVTVSENDLAPGVLNRIDNISANGALCCTNDSVALMTPIGITFDLPAPTSLKVQAKGVVVRCQQDGRDGNSFKVAVLFTNIADDARDAIQAFVSHDLNHP